MHRFTTFPFFTILRTSRMQVSPLHAIQVVASPHAGFRCDRSCLQRPQVREGPCLALQLLWPSSCMPTHVSLTSDDGSHDPARFSDCDRALRTSQSSLPRTMCPASHWSRLRVPDVTCTRMLTLAQRSCCASHRCMLQSHVHYSRALQIRQCQPLHCS